MKTALRQKAEQPIDLDLLTPRQRDIMRLVSIGHTNREIANILQISARTVEVHRFNLMQRLNVRNVAQLFKRALQLGLLSFHQSSSQVSSTLELKRPESSSSARGGRLLSFRKRPPQNTP
jgi:DNA-binding CsgD family transcriptional regulator